MNAINSTARLAIAIAVTLVVGLALGYVIFGRTDDTQAARPAAKTEEREVLYWHDPMVPGARFDKPGKSPFMDMDLVPVYADEGAALVRIDPHVTQNLGMRTGRVERKTLNESVDAVGAVAFDERLLEVVQARVTGYVTRLYVKAPMTRVRRGEPLLEILAPDWLAAQQDYLALLDASAPSVAAIRDAARERLVVLGMPESAIQSIERTRKTNATTTVSAPIEGVVEELAVREGAAFEAGAPLVRINGLSTVWVNAQVPESQAALVHKGVQVEARATAWPGETFSGRVLELLPDVDAETRTVPMRVAIENEDDKLAPGMFVALSFEVGRGEPQLVAPTEALIPTGRRTVAIVAGNGRFEPVEVHTGREIDGYTVILDGLQEDDEIVLSGQFLIDSEASLRSTIDRLRQTPPESADHGGHTNAPAGDQPPEHDHSMHTAPAADHEAHDHSMHEHSQHPAPSSDHDAHEHS